VYSAKELIVQQQREALEELAKTTVTLARLRKLLREQHGYEPAALEEMCGPRFDRTATTSHG
jgi:hypothetical protein